VGGAEKHVEDSNLSRSEWEHIIDEWTFNETDRNLLKRRLLDGITYEKLAEEFQLSTVGVKKRVYKAQNKLFKHI